jgi:chloramphenicol 3-O-phosphotransferase
MVGTEENRLVILRGNSASGKLSVAVGMREKFGRGLALVGQDNLRRIVLRERDRPGAANIGLIDLTARYALSLRVTVRCAWMSAAQCRCS